MKNLLFLIVTVFYICSCTSKPDGYEVTIDLKNAKNEQIYVSERIPHPTTWYTDTIQLKDGKAVFKGKVTDPHWVAFVVVKEDGELQGSFGMFLDNSQVQVKGDYNNLKQVEITGSKTNDEYQRIEKNGVEVFRNFGRIRYERSKAFKDDRARYDSLTPLYQEAYNKLFDYIVSLPGYATSQVAPHYVWEYFAEDLDKMGKALAGFDASLNSNVFVAECRDNWEKEKKVQPGQPAYDFTLSDIDGKVYKLSDFRGKYVLIEFSASWCGWCKLEIPYLKTVYENTKGKNFVMFTVNMDEDREKWEKDVKEYNLPWPVVSDLKAYSGPVAQNYHVKGIPMIYLIDPEGKIMARDLRREPMIEYINKLFK